MMARYHRRDEQTAALIWRDARGRSWIRSGDVGKLDADAPQLFNRQKPLALAFAIWSDRPNLRPNWTQRICRT